MQEFSGSSNTVDVCREVTKPGHQCNKGYTVIQTHIYNLCVIVRHTCLFYSLPIIMSTSWQQDHQSQWPQPENQHPQWSQDDPNLWQWMHQQQRSQVQDAPYLSTNPPELSDVLLAEFRFSPAFQHRLEAFAVLELDWLCYHENCKTLRLLRSLSETERLALVSRALNLFKLLSILRANTKAVLHSFFEVQPVENIPDIHTILLPELKNESQLRKSLRESLEKIQFLFGQGVQAQVTSHVARSQDLFTAGCRELAAALAVLQVPTGHWPTKEIKEMHKSVQKTLREVLILGTLAVAPGMEREPVAAVLADVLGTARAGENAVSQCLNGFRKTLLEAAQQSQTGKKPVVVAPDPRRRLTSIPEEQAQGEDAEILAEQQHHSDSLEQAQLLTAIAASNTEAAMRNSSTSQSAKNQIAHAQHIQAEAERLLRKVEEQNVSSTMTGNISSSRGISNSSHGMVPVAHGGGGSANNTGSSSHSVQSMDWLHSKSSYSNSSCSNSTGTMDVASRRHLELIVKLDQLLELTKNTKSAPMVQHVLCGAASDSDTNEDDRVSCSSVTSSVTQEYTVIHH